MDEFRFNNEKYGYGRGYLYIPLLLDRSNLPEEISFENEALLLKSKFHVCFMKIPSVLEQFGLEMAREHEIRILDIFHKHVSENVIFFEKFTGECWLVDRERDNRRSIVAPCALSNLKEFTDKVMKEFGGECDYYPTHATLYTRGLDMGIGINSKVDIEKYVVDKTDEYKWLFPELEVLG